MKKDRNCGMTPYPTYQQYGAMPVPGMAMPNMIGPMGPNVMPVPIYSQGNPNMSNTSSTSSSQSSIENQINMLDRRVTKLEALVNSTSTYNNFDSNYHVM